jgi:hypothetical protein
MNLPAKALAMWLLLLVVMMLNGALRVLLLQPRFGEEAARQLATLSGIVLVLALSRPFVVWAGRPGSRTLLGVGLAWVALTLAFEFGFGWAAGRSLAEMLADYALWRGRLWPLFLVATLLGPMLWGRSARGAGLRGGSAGAV